MKHFTQEQIVWAKGHDWFIGISEDYMLIGDQDGVYKTSNFQELYTWAGY